MGRVIDVGVDLRQNVGAPVRVLLRVLQSKADGPSRIRILTDTNVVGGAFIESSVDVDELITEFETKHVSGFHIIVGRGRFVCVWPPRYLGGQLNTWRIIGETNDNWDLSMLDELLALAQVEYAAISQDEALDLEKLDHVRSSNFPWRDWRLIAARVAS